MFFVEAGNDKVLLSKKFCNIGRVVLAYKADKPDDLLFQPIFFAHRVDPQQLIHQVESKELPLEQLEVARLRVML